MLKDFIDRYLGILARKITDVELDLTYQTYKLATKETLDFITENRLGKMQKFQNNDQLYSSLKNKIGSGVILEFGVYRGRSINYFAKLFPRNQIYGFDSFTGLPEDWVILPEGAFNLGGKTPNVESNVKLITGMIDDTLPNFKIDKQIELIHIDTDLYSSAKTILELLKDQISNTYLLFDEFWNYPNWKDGEYRAFMEFIQKTGKNFQYVAHSNRSSVLLKITDKLEPDTTILGEMDTVRFQKANEL